MSGFRSYKFSSFSRNEKMHVWFIMISKFQNGCFKSFRDIRGPNKRNAILQLDVLHQVLWKISSIFEWMCMWIAIPTNKNAEFWSDLTTNGICIRNTWNICNIQICNACNLLLRCTVFKHLKFLWILQMQSTSVYFFPFLAGVALGSKNW